MMPNLHQLFRSQKGLDQMAIGFSNTVCIDIAFRAAEWDWAAAWEHA
jgi:hypothetical protein